jgi:thioredoxin-related protein
MNITVKIKILLSSILLIFFLSANNQSSAEELQWQKTAVSAFYKAVTQKKKIVLFVGRDSCGKCRYMRTRVFESMKPAVKTLLENKFILWLSDADQSKEWHPVARDLREISLPLICIIDPETGSAYEDRSTGIQDSPEFYSRLLKHIED